VLRYPKNEMSRSSGPSARCRRTPWSWALSLVAAVGLLASPAPAQEIDPAPLTGPDVKAASAILVDAATGTVLWEKNSQVRRPMASTTKIMTATLLLESDRLDEWVPFTEHARTTPYANFNARPNEKVRLRDLLYAIMLRSSNDGCVAAAEHVAGSPWKFAQDMTAKAKALGALDTNFVTTNGLYHPQHYSTAYDLAIMTRYAMQNPLFNEIVATKSKTISRTLNWKDTVVTTHNKFLSRYPGADGVKTGYVKEAGRCLVSSATHQESGAPWRLIAVVLNSPDMYTESARLMDWGFQNFQPVFVARKGESVGMATVQGGSEEQVPLVAASDLKMVVRREFGNDTEREIRMREGLQAPVLRDQVAGTLVALVNGRAVGQVDLIAARPVTQVWTAGMGPWTGASMGFLALLLGPRYVRKVAKSARRRRRRLPAGRREPDSQWPGHG